MITQPLYAWKLQPSQDIHSLQSMEISAHVATLDQFCLELPLGAYTTLRTYEGGKVLHLDAHLQRLQATAELVGTEVHLDFKLVRQALRELVQGKPRHGDLRIRLVVDLEEQPGMLYMAVKPLQVPPPAAYQAGVWVVTSRLQRNLPRAKLTRFIANADLERQSLPSGANEALLLDQQGCILEGLSSNFFAVYQGVLCTADQDVLLGTTRQWVIELAGWMGIRLKLGAVPLSSLVEYEEAFITSASRGVLPVRQVEQTVIGPGWPGPITRGLIDTFAARLSQELEEI